MDMACLLQTGLRLVFLGAQVVMTSSHGGTKYHISSVAPEADSLPLRHSPTHVCYRLLHPFRPCLSKANNLSIFPPSA